MIVKNKDEDEIEKDEEDDEKRKIKKSKKQESKLSFYKNYTPHLLYNWLISSNIGLTIITIILIPQLSLP